MKLATTEPAAATDVSNSEAMFGSKESNTRRFAPDRNAAIANS